ncbi:MAG: Crp/Fnr family transcriptional regulator, partial [Pedobacter sp.]|nr:Crp/Fnr family transcriptional regulator [Pedobacter sp.]
MKAFTAYSLKYGNLNKQQIELIETKGTEMSLKKEAYFSEAGMIPRQVGFIVEGVIRGCYYNNKGDEITRCFVGKDSLVVDYINFEADTASSEYLQAC